MLEARQRQLTDDTQSMMQSVRTRGSEDRDVADVQDVGAGDVQDDLELALLQMKSETLRKIASALRRLDEGKYGDCAECGVPIAAARLTALPFALRCRSCEGAREVRAAREQTGRTAAQESLYRLD